MFIPSPNEFLKKIKNRILTDEKIIITVIGKQQRGMSYCSLKIADMINNNYVVRDSRKISR